MFISGFQPVNDSRSSPRILFVLSCARGRYCTFSLGAVEACVMVWSCPEHGASVRTMLLLYGEAITIITEFFYGRSGSRTLTTQLLLFSPGGCQGVKVCARCAPAKTRATFEWRQRDGAYWYSREEKKKKKMGS